MSKALVLGAGALVFSAAGAFAADLVAPGYGYAAPVYMAPAPTVFGAPIYAAPPADPAPHVYAAAPLINYASHPVPPEPIPGPIYDYAPGYGYDYTAPGYWNRGYWGPGYGFEWR
jgi:hypothetical protein